MSAQQENEKALKNITLYRIKNGTNFPALLEGSDWKKFKRTIAGIEIEGFAIFDDGKGQPKTEKDIPYLKLLNSVLADDEKFPYKAWNNYPRGCLIFKFMNNGQEYFFAAAFGIGGDSFFDKDYIVRDYGIIAGMNMCDMDKLRLTQTSMPGLKSLHIERQAGSGLDLYSFGINFEAEILRNIAGYIAPQYKKYAKSFKGKDAISLSANRDDDFTLEKLINTVQILDKRHISKDYQKTQFKVFDWFRPTQDKFILTSLNDGLFQRIMGNDFSKLFLAPPEFQNRDDLAYCYSEKGENLHEELAITDFLQKHPRARENLTADALKRLKVYSYDTTEKRIIDTWSAYNCIVAEERHGNDIYILQSGQWHLVSQDLVNEIDSYLRKNKIGDTPPLLSPIKVPSDCEYTEGAYNEQMALQRGELYLFDKANITISGKKYYEICDIMSQERQLIHVKRYKSGCSDISHLFVQVRFYAKAFKYEEATRKSMREYIDTSTISANRSKEKEKFKALIPESNDDFRAEQWTIILCALDRRKTSGSSVYDLPLMAKYELMRTHKYLTLDLGFQCCFELQKFKRIAEIPTTTRDIQAEHHLTA